MVRWMHLDRRIQHRGPDLELGWRIITYEERCPGWAVRLPVVAAHRTASRAFAAPYRDLELCVPYSTYYVSSGRIPRAVGPDMAIRLEGAQRPMHTAWGSYLPSRNRCGADAKFFLFGGGGHCVAPASSSERHWVAGG
jgi:hypothetical protein